MDRGKQGIIETVKKKPKKTIKMKCVKGFAHGKKRYRRHRIYDITRNHPMVCLRDTTSGEFYYKAGKIYSVPEDHPSMVHFKKLEGTV